MTLEAYLTKKRVDANALVRESGNRLYTNTTFRFGIGDLLATNITPTKVGAVAGVLASETIQYSLHYAITGDPSWALAQDIAFHLTPPLCIIAIVTDVVAGHLGAIEGQRVYNQITQLLKK
jgi:hypothetical protein